MGSLGIRLQILVLFISLFLVVTSADPVKKMQHLEPRVERGKSLGRTLYDAIPEDGRPSLSGYLTVNHTAKAEIFFTFYEATESKKAVEDTPIILWLQGGPGCSSQIGNFYELGPYIITEEYPARLKKNPGRMNRKFGILYFDNPVGVGFSETDDPDAVPHSERQVAWDLYLALTRFFSEHVPHSFRHRPFFIAGESYGGKYIPSLGYYTLKWRNELRRNVAPDAAYPEGTYPEDTHLDDTRPADYLQLPSSRAADGSLRPGLSRGEHPFRLDGLLVGNGMTDPRIMIGSHALQWYYFGIVDGHERDRLFEWARLVEQLIDSKDWIGAADERKKMLLWGKQIAGVATLFNLRRPTKYHTTRDGKDIMKEWLNRKEVQAALGVREGFSARVKPCDATTSQLLRADLMKSVRWMVDHILSSLPVLLFQGQLDAKEGPASTEDWIQTLSWNGKHGFMQQNRTIWRMDGVLAGYIKHHSNLTHVTVLSAGHMAIHDQPTRMRDLIENWVEQQLERSQK